MPHFTDGATEAQEGMGLEGEGHIVRKQQSRDSSLDITKTGRVVLRGADLTSQGAV